MNTRGIKEETIKVSNNSNTFYIETLPNSILRVIELLLALPRHDIYLAHIFNVLGIYLQC